mmetsp:Transcript_22484/g.71903  ORF Transcript_22484/g.71903 Transcript_22484/m.71903 type:complete len:208 (-) Transcript_22484:546-1169(-)
MSLSLFAARKEATRSGLARDGGRASMHPRLVARREGTRRRHISVVSRLHLGYISRPKQTTGDPRSSFMWTPSTASDLVGSDQSRSSISSACCPPTRSGRCISAICSSELSVLPMPPCTHRMQPLTVAAIGSHSKSRLRRRQTATPGFLPPSRRAHSCRKPSRAFTSGDSWLPRTRKTARGWAALRASSKTTVSRECLPRSTKSPRKR